MKRVGSTEMILRRRLKDVGLSDPAVNAAWPGWWSGAAEASPSAVTELRFSLARKLGLDPRSLIDDQTSPQFVWRDEARFKHGTATSDEEARITSFGTALANMLTSATPSPPRPLPDAATLRRIVLSNRPFVGLYDLLAISWSAAIPVVHLRVFPGIHKRMAAMAVSTGDRAAILLGKDSDYPAHIAFYLAHELGHIALGHLGKHQSVLIDLESELRRPLDDQEELEADQYALELLTGNPEPIVRPYAKRYIATQLARDASQSSYSLGIEAGTLALCFGYSTGNWRTVNAAMKSIYPNPTPVWKEVNSVARRELSLEELPEDYTEYLSAVMGYAAIA